MGQLDHSCTNNSISLDSGNNMPVILIPDLLFSRRTAVLQPAQIPVSRLIFYIVIHE
ncbi:hypothetical protein D3C76_1820990 [compost metagenome]